MSATLRESYGAMIRGDDGNLHIRHYRTPAQAAAMAAAHRELHEPAILTGAGIKSAALARELGLCGKTIRRAYAAGELPGIEHGPKTLIIPHKVARAVRTYGLLGVRAMMRSGRF